MTLWLLDTPDETTLDLSAQVADGDFVLRPDGEEVQVGKARPGRDPEVDWCGEVDAGLMPDTDALADAEGRTPLQRLEGHPELEQAVARVAEAHDLRGG